MKTIISILLLVSLFCLSGCVSGSLKDDGLIQTVLNEVLPPDFEGDMQADHDGFYFGTSVHITFDLKGLKKVDGKWSWTSGGYKRSGFFSTGGIKLTPKTK